MMKSIVFVFVCVFVSVSAGCGSENIATHSDPSILELERQFQACLEDSHWDAVEYYKANRMVRLDGDIVVVSRFSEGYYDHRGVWWSSTVKGDCVFNSH